MQKQDHFNEQHIFNIRAEVERLGGNGTLIEVLDQLKDWEEDWAGFGSQPVMDSCDQIPCDSH